MADGTIQGDADPSGLTAPGELHLDIGPLGADASSAGALGFGSSAFPWWLVIVAGVALWLIVRR